MNEIEVKKVYISNEEMRTLMPKRTLDIGSINNTIDCTTIDSSDINDFENIKMETKSPGIAIESTSEGLEPEINFVEKIPIQNKVIGLAFAFLSLAGYTMYALLTKYFAEISLDLILFFLAGLYFMIILSQKLYYGDVLLLQLPWENTKWCLLAAIFDVTDIIARIISVKYIPVELAVGISCCTPIVATILELIVIPGEFPFSLAVKRIGVALIITCGLILHTYGTVSHLMDDYYIVVVGIIWSLVALISRVCINILIRKEKIRNPETYCLSHWYMARICLYIPTGIILHFCFSNTSEGFTSIWIERSVIASAILGFMAFIGAIGMDSSHGYIPASTAVSLRTLEIPFVFTIAIFYMPETINVFSIVGCFISFLGCISMELFFSSL